MITEIGSEEQNCHNHSFCDSYWETEIKKGILYLFK